MKWWIHVGIFLFYFFRYYMLLKLFIAMGLTWILELIALAVTLLVDEGDVPQWISIILNIANVLQGIVVFIVFGFKPSVRNHIREKYLGNNSQNSQSQQRSRKISIPTESSSGSIIRRNSTRAPPTLMKSVSYSPYNDGSNVEFIASSDNEQA